jgi:alpha/beta superfamily hydrolase
MNSQTQYFYIHGAAGQLQCALDLPDPEHFPAIRGVGLVAHPHPLYGGTMQNKVAQTLARGFVSLGYAAARMNFRGVGDSAGVHDEGRGETDDMELLLADMQQRYPGLPVALAGFSFGTFVQANMHQRLVQQGVAIERLVLAGTAAGKWAVPEVPKDSIIIHGEQDDTIPLQDVFEWARPQDLPVIVVPGCDHFFNRKLQHIKNYMIDLWHR